MACEVFMTEKTRAPAAVLERIHANLRTTRGAAVIMIEIDWERGQLLAAGIGNMVAADHRGQLGEADPVLQRHRRTRHAAHPRAELPDRARGDDRIFTRTG